jgi:hypothetical protein
MNSLGGFPKLGHPGHFLDCRWLIRVAMQKTLPLHHEEEVVRGEASPGLTGWFLPRSFLRSFLLRLAATRGALSFAFFLGGVFVLFLSNCFTLFHALFLDHCLVLFLKVLILLRSLPAIMFEDTVHGQIVQFLHIFFHIRIFFTAFDDSIGIIEKLTKARPLLFELLSVRKKGREGTAKFVRLSFHMIASSNNDS